MKRLTLAVILAAAALPAVAAPSKAEQKNIEAGVCVAVLTYQHRPDADIRAAFAAAPDINVAGMHAQRWLEFTVEAAKERDPQAAMAQLVERGKLGCKAIGVKA